MDTVTTPKKGQATRFLLVGLGPCAKRTHAKQLVFLKKAGRAELVCAIDVESKREELVQYRDDHFPEVELVFVAPFTTHMPQELTAELNQLLRRLRVDCVIISTEPQSHKAYGLWALDQGLNIIMDKPVTTRKGAITDMAEACGIAQDYNDLLFAYEKLQSRRRTMFLIASHRRYHPAYIATFQMLKQMAEKSGSPVTNITSTHCDGQWRFPTELVDQPYHGFSDGHGKVSHSGYHILDTTYRYMKAGWINSKKPDKIEVISSFVTVAGFLKTLTHEDYLRVFGDDYEKSRKYTHEQIEALVAGGGEVDAAIQLTFYKQDVSIMMAQLNLLHNGFSRRSWISPIEDWYKGSGRVKHEAHEIRSGPFQTIVLDSRQASDNQDRSKSNSAKIGSGNHFEVHVFKNCDLFGEAEPLTSCSMADIDRQHITALPGIYTENVKGGILREALDYLEGRKEVEDLVSNIDDHSVPAHLMSATYMSHIRRVRGENPIVTIDLSYGPGIRPSKCSIRCLASFIPL
ncbi:hypothetical protein DL768_002052 [Monosporascus sp. mg162]|nr:hypothetical protein DL768_002052 [Monosporascus sp. mg162]